jgi:transcription initiation factor TFIID TATA-box-binding protein
MNIVNIVGSGELRDRISLEKLVMNSEKYDLEYDPEVHQGAYIRFGADKPLISIYASGSYIIRASNEDDLFKTKNQLSEYLEERGLGILSGKFSIQNFVFTEDLETEINIDKIALEKEEAEYDPETFPGMILRKEKGTILVFSSGKVVISGAESKDDAKDALKYLREDILT